MNGAAPSLDKIKKEVQAALRRMPEDVVLLG
jgi:hypothetical protein